MAAELGHGAMVDLVEMLAAHDEVERRRLQLSQEVMMPRRSLMERLWQAQRAQIYSSSSYGEEAEGRAHELLLRMLTPEQREMYERDGCFFVERGDRKYKLDRYSMQVHVCDLGGNGIDRWCGYIPNAPREDTLIAQLLLLRDDPEKLYKVAQRHLPVSGGVMPQQDTRRVPVISLFLEDDREELERRQFAVMDAYGIVSSAEFGPDLVLNPREL